jgi:glycerol-3-phosphate dehydrogenase
VGPALREYVRSGEPSRVWAPVITHTDMRRDIPRLADTGFDLLIVGAGIYGACAAWDASLRGLSVAVVDQDDFGAATSANSLRIVHGGLRYLARGDFSRMRESIRERSTLLRIAPGLVQPLQVLVPTYGLGARGRLAFGAALKLNDLVSAGRNRRLDRNQRIPGGRLLSRDDCLALFPWFTAQGLSGGAVWYDAQLRHPERLTLSFLQAAASRGAVPVNYLRIDRVRTGNGSVDGAFATDLQTGAQLEIRARAVLVAAGPWTREIVATAADSGRAAPRPARALAVNAVVRRRLADVAVGVRARSGRTDDPVCGGGRFLFSAPQGAGTLLGTWYTTEMSDVRAARDRGAATLLREFNDACPGLDLSREEIVRAQWGWLPLKNGQESGRPGALAERPRITNYGRTHGMRNLLSVEGVKFTTARLVAEQAIDDVFASLGRPSPQCRTAELRLNTAPTEMAVQPDGAVTPGEVLRAVREEMALKLSDVVFRRTTLGAPPGPTRTAVEVAADAMAAELGWDTLRQAEEIEAVMREAGAPGHAVEAVT